MSKVHKAIRVVCLATIAALLIASIGVAYGRYSSVIRDTIRFQAAKNDGSHAIEIRSGSSWQVTADGVTLAFSLVNAGNETGQRATLRLTATEGFSANNAMVTLTVGGTAYTATPRAVTAGDPLHDKMGNGTEYRFYAANNELTWAVSDGQNYTLTVKGAADVSLLRLTATEA